MSRAARAWVTEHFGDERVLAAVTGFYRGMSQTQSLIQAPVLRSL